MKKYKGFLIILCFSFSACFKTFAQAPSPVGLVPSARQIEWYHREIQAFFHFGMNTFTNVNEGDGTSSATLFNPTALDCNQWMNVLKGAGITCGILVAKHTDGFCNWPSEYTDYCVKNSPWKNGKGDLVKEYTDACKAAGIKAGLYLGPYDKHQHLDSKYTIASYNTYYASELSELMRNYGAIWETWWDGADADELTTPLYTRWADTIRNLQSQCIIFGTKNSYRQADCRWVGNESGTAGDPCWATIDSSSILNESAHLTQLNQGERNGNAYIPAESDVSLRPSWFYHPEEDGQAKTVSQLWEIYCNTVGHNAVLLLNFSPDKRGLISSDDSVKANGLRNWIDNTFKTNLAKGATITCLHTRGDAYSPNNLVDNLENTYYASSDANVTDTITLHLVSAKTFDCLMLQEVLELGQRTTGWTVDYSTDGSTWKPVPGATGKTCIGNKWIITCRPITASYVRLRITDGKACIAIHTFGIYKQPSLPPAPVTVLDDTDQGTGLNQFNYVGNNWGHATGENSTTPSPYKGTNSFDNTPNDYYTIDFIGTQIKFYGVKDPGHGIGAVSIDGGTETNLDFYASSRSGNQLLWTSAVLDSGYHTFTMRVTGIKNPKSSDAYLSADRVAIIDTIISLTNSIEEISLNKKNDFKNFPNPFKENTVLSYKLSEVCDVHLNIFDVHGRELATLVNKTKELPDYYQVEWNAISYPAGIYIARLTIGSNSMIIKLTLVK